MNSGRASAKKQLCSANFLHSLVTFDRSSLNEETLEVLVTTRRSPHHSVISGRAPTDCSRVQDAYTCRKEFQPEEIQNSSKAVYSLRTWCVAMQVFGKVELELRAQQAAVERTQAFLDHKGRELRDAEHVSKNDEFRIKNVEICMRNEEICI